MTLSKWASTSKFESSEIFALIFSTTRSISAWLKPASFNLEICASFKENSSFSFFSSFFSSFSRVFSSFLSWFKSKASSFLSSDFSFESSLSAKSFEFLSFKSSLTSGFSTFFSSKLGFWTLSTDSISLDFTKSAFEEDGAIIKEKPNIQETRPIDNFLVPYLGVFFDSKDFFLLIISLNFFEFFIFILSIICCTKLNKYILWFRISMLL